jgi:hypothetical protein
MGKNRWPRLCPSAPTTPEARSLVKNGCLQMPSRRDPTAKRLEKLFEQSRKVNQKTVGEFLFEKAGLSFDDFPFDLDVVHASFSRLALRLDENNANDKPMLLAFKSAGLDWRDPHSWRHLLSLFAEAHFGDTETKPKTWDIAAFCEVLIDYFVARKTLGNKSTDLAICKLLKINKKYRHKYGDYNIHALRKIVRTALSPKHNILLRHPEMKNIPLQLVRNHSESEGITWDETLEGWANLIV